MHVPANLSALIETRGSPLASLTPIETLAAPRHATVFRLTCADGGVWKVRRLASEAQAAQMQRLTALAGRDFSQVLARTGDTVLEEWISGRVLSGTGNPGPALAERCGAMLGRLHLKADADGPPHDGVAAAVARIDGHLRDAAALGALAPATLRDVRRVLEEFRPAHASVGLVHVDFCGENLIEAADRRLVCVDNATLRQGQHDHDLGRTWYRWPLDGEARRAFLAGYQSSRSATTFLEHFPFWALDALLLSIAFRAGLRLPGVQEPIARLQALLDALAGRHAPRELFFH